MNNNSKGETVYILIDFIHRVHNPEISELVTKIGFVKSTAEMLPWALCTFETQVSQKIHYRIIYYYISYTHTHTHIS